MVVAIKKGEKEVIPRGDTIIYSGDFLHILVSESGAAAINECFENDLLLKLNV